MLDVLVDIRLDAALRRVDLQAGEDGERLRLLPIGQPDTVDARTAREHQSKAGVELAELAATDHHAKHDALLRRTIDVLTDEGQPRLPAHAARALERKVAMLARAYGDRVGRGRLRADATLMPARPPRGNAILTAEQTPEIGESGLARCLTVELHPGGFDTDAYKFFEDASRQGLLQSCMLLFTTWLRGKFLCNDEADVRLLKS